MKARSVARIDAMSLSRYLFEREPRAVVISDGVVGHEKQSFALWAALGLSGDPSTRKDTAPVQPDLIISCGRRAAAKARRDWRGGNRRALWVQILNPVWGEYDLLITPSHDGIVGENVLTTLGALVRPRSPAGARDPNKPCAALLLGDVEDFKPVEAAIQILAGRGFHLLVSASRRSSAALNAKLSSALAPFEHTHYQGQGANPYDDWLDRAEHIAVSNDSINMLSEAIATTAAVSVLETTAVKLKHWRMLDSVRAWRRLSPLNESAQAPALNETPFVALEVARRLSARMHGSG